MGKTRGKRRTVLQLSDNKESFLARYGYGRQNEEDEDSRGVYGEVPYDEDDVPTDEELDEGHSAKVDDSADSLPVGQQNGGKTDIDDKVADFLAEIDAMPVPEDEEEEEEEEERPSFKVEIPPPSFKLSADQQGSFEKEKVSLKSFVKDEIPVSSYKKQDDFTKDTESKSKYRSMFVKGASEFTGQRDQASSQTKDLKEEEWPEEPVSVWQQTVDENTQYMYYWNTVTNEVTWEIPPEFTQYLLLRKEYEEKVDKLTKEGRVKPTKPTSKQIVPDSGGSDKTSTFGPELVPQDVSSHQGGDNSRVSSTSSLPILKKSGILKNSEQASPKPDSTKSSKPSLVDATYFDDSDAESSSSSDGGDSEEPKGKPGKRKTGDKEDSDSVGMDMDIDDIDAALDMAFDSKKSKRSEDKKAGKDDSKSDRKKKDNQVPKQKSLVEEMKAQVQKRQEMEARNAARRKAAIEEMMARELERRVGPPRKRSSEEDLPQTVWDSKRTKTTDYGHKKREHEHGSHRSSSERDSKRKHEDRKDKKKKKEDKDRRHSRDRDEKSERKKDRDKDEKRKDKHRDRDDKKKDKDGKKDKDKKESKKEEKKEKKEETEIKTEEKKVEEEVEKVETEVVKKEEVTDPEELPPETEKFLEKVLVKNEDRSKEVQLANLKMQASELADLALSKLEFLEVTKKGLSKLQILLIELETRHHDWQAGGLNTEFFVAKLEEANWQLQQYEQSAAPPGWTCHWDRAYRRYFYMSKKNKRTQWDYPDDDDEEEDEENEQDEKNAESDAEDRDKFIPKPPDNRPGYDIDMSPETPSLSSEPSSMLSSARDIDQVTSTTISGAARSEVGSSADTTFLSKPAVVSSSHSGSLEVPRSKESGQDHQLSQVEPGSHQQGSSYNNYLSGADMSIFRGEPPPPGTGYEMLLTAPPPPPPPDESGHQGYGSASDEDDRDNVKHSIQNSDSDMDVDSNEALPSSVQTYGLQPDSALSYSVDTAKDQMYTQNIPGLDPVSNVITRGPQIFSSDAGPVIQSSQGFGDGYYGGTVSDGVPYDTGASFIPSSSTQDFNEGEGGSGHPSPYQQDREKKKKKKDKTMSSTSLTLKKKNVSSLVQKWQKVKKEVEIEERNREEREMAIRQQLEELKQEYS